MISIIVPCYNAAATLEETLRSALDQDVEKELIVVDDGSTDDSPAVIRSFGDAILAVRTPNRGVSAARTMGSELAKGRFLQFLDSDDLLAPGTLARRVEALETEAADVAHTDWQKIVPSGAAGYEFADIIAANTEALDRDPQAATATSAFWAPPAALLYRRSIVDRIQWSRRLPIIQDARFLFDAAAQGARFIHVPGVGAYYRINSGSLSRRNTAQFIADCAVNAAEIEAIWTRETVIADVRKEALAAMWWHVAHASAVHGLEHFEAAYRHYRSYKPRRLRMEVVAAARRVLGANLVAYAWHHVRSSSQLMKRKFTALARLRTPVHPRSRDDNSTAA